MSPLGTIKTNRQQGGNTRGKGKIFNIKTMFLIALKLEFHLLHPVIGMLFQYLGSRVNSENPADSYHQHTRKFFKILPGYGQLTPVLEPLNRTWRTCGKNRRLPGWRGRPTVNT